MRRPYLDYLGTPMADSELVENIETIFSNARSVEEEIKSLNIRKRLKYITQLKEVLIKKQDKVLEFIKRETFKSPTDIFTSEVFGPIDFLVFIEKNAGRCLKDKEVPTPLALQGKKSYLYHEPHGVVLSIAPWNYPLFNAIVHSASSFICGNATIFKPSEVTPMKGLLEEIFEEAGFKPNWIQVVYGDGEIGKKLIDQGPDKIFFIGSVETGKKIMAQASPYLIPVELELGGKDPMIVFEDADLHRTTSGALWGGCVASGQSCTSVERLLIQESIYDRFKELLIKKAELIKVGDQNDPDIEMGPMVTEYQTAIIREHLEDALSKGAVLLTGKNWDKKSKEIPPLILEGVTREMIVWDEESFGPLIPIYSFKDEAEALRMANDSQFGLSASIWSNDISRCKRVGKKIKTGNISINNVMLTEGNANLPFGGCKKSGFGRYKGDQGFEAFSNLKSVLIDKNSSHVEAHWYPFDETKHNYFKKLIGNLFSGDLFGLIKTGLVAKKLEKHADKISRQGL